MTKAKIPPKAAKPGKDVVYVDHDDEITSIIDKVEAAKNKVVAMVLPKRFTTLQSIVNMRLLKRSADNAGKSVVLITSEAALLPLAGAAGLHVAKNLQSKPEIPPSPIDDKELPEEAADPDAELEGEPAKLDYHRSIGELAASHEVEEPETIPLGDDKESAAADKPAKKSKKVKGLAIPDFDKFRLLLGAGILGVIALIIFLIFAVKVLPKATITIQTTSTPVLADFSLSASDSVKALDEEKKLIPAELKKSDQTSSQQVQATGQKNQGEKATGSVKLSIPCASVSGSAPKVAAGTGVTAGGLVFITQKTAELDNAEFSGGCKFTDTVTVAAQQAGAKYNIGPSSFTVSGSSSITGSSSAAMTGGTDNILTIVTQADLDNAKKKITAAESDKFSADFQKQLEDSGSYVLASTLKLADPVVTSSPALGQEATNVNVTIKITYSVLTVPKADLEKLVLSSVNEQIDKNRQEIGDEDILKKAEITVVNQTSPTATGLDVSIETTAVPIIDEAAVKKQVGGKKESEIKSLIMAWPGVKDVKVKTSPFWVSKPPKNPSKVTVKLEPVSEGQN